MQSAFHLLTLNEHFNVVAFVTDTGKRSIQRFKGESCFYSPNRIYSWLKEDGIMLHKYSIDLKGGSTAEWGSNFLRLTLIISFTPPAQCAVEIVAEIDSTGICMDGFKSMKAEKSHFNHHLERCYGNDNPPHFTVNGLETFIVLMAPSPPVSERSHAYTHGPRTKQ